MRAVVRALGLVVLAVVLVVGITVVVRTTLAGERPTLLGTGGSGGEAGLAVVTHVVDGDTLDVRYDGREYRVRLLNVDAPESVRPDHPVECLGPEAAAFLEELAPVGSDVRLEFDVERQDRFGRELAAVYAGEVLVNAELARAGLGTAVLFEPNDRFYDDVLDAEREARRAGVGLHAADPCTGG